MTSRLGDPGLKPYSLADAIREEERAFERWRCCPRSLSISVCIVVLTLASASVSAVSTWLFIPNDAQWSEKPYLDESPDQNNGIDD